MTKWKNYHEKKNGYSKEEEKKDAPGAEIIKKLDDIGTMNLEAAAKAAREAMAMGQIREINEAVGAARAKGISTDGKVVGTSAVMASISSGAGFSGPDVGVETLIEADENNPNRADDYHEVDYSSGVGASSENTSGNDTSTDGDQQEREEDTVPVPVWDDDICL